MDISVVTSKQSIPKLDWRMPVEVMMDFDTVRLFGKLAAVSPTELTVRRTSSELCFPIIEEESAVLVRCYDVQMDPVILRAKVIRSSGMECTVGKLEVIPYRTHRKDTRYPLCPPVVASVLDGTVQEQIKPCQLLNISVGGACIVTGCGYDVGQALQLQVGPAKADGCVPYPCKVIRVTPRRGGYFECGLLFEQLSRGQIRCLAKILQEWFHVSLDVPGEPPNE